MNRVLHLALGALAGTLALAGCAGEHPSTSVAPSLASPTTTAVYMPPEVPLESVFIKGHATTQPGSSPDFADVTARLARHYRGRFLATGQSGTHGDAGFWIVLTERPGRWALEQLASLPVDVEVKYGAPATKPQLDAVAAALVSSMRQQGDEFADVEAGPSRFATRMVVRYGVRSPGPIGPQSLDDALTAAASVSEGGTLPVPVEFVHEPGLDSPAS